MLSAGKTVQDPPIAGAWALAVQANPNTVKQRNAEV
jgi:hypothetical protein